MALLQALPSVSTRLLGSSSVVERRSLRWEPGFFLASAFCALYAAVFIVLGDVKYTHFQIGGDTADYTQMLWNTIHGQLLGKTSLYAAAIIRDIPPAAPIDADYALAAHLANRTYLFQLQDVRQASLAPYVLLDLHADYHDPPAWMVGMDQATLAYMRKVGGFRIWRADRTYGLYVYLNCGRFPSTAGCGKG